MHLAMHPTYNKNSILTLKGNGKYITQKDTKKFPYPGQQCPQSFLACLTSCMLTCKLPQLCLLQAVHQQITTPARVQLFNLNSFFTDIMSIFLT